MSDMSDEQLANRLLCALSAEMIRKSELFDYLCWLEESEQEERVPGAKILVLSRYGVTCWGNTYQEAVEAAMEHDKGIYSVSKTEDGR